MSGLPLDRMRCCFCGEGTTGTDYVQLELRIDGTGARQFFGAHRGHLQERLARGFTVELEPDDD